VRPLKMSRALGIALALLLLTTSCRASPRAHPAPYPRAYLAAIREHGGCGLWLHLRTPNGTITKPPPPPQRCWKWLWEHHFKGHTAPYPPGAQP